jgi:hypothetical protein
MNIKKILYKILAYVSFGFYIHPLCGFENPAHPRTPEEMQKEDDEKNPANRYERKQLDEIDPDHAPHSEEERKKWAEK